MATDSRQSFRDLIRSADGVMDKKDYRRGVAVLGILTILVAGILYGVTILRASMDWMTVAVAPLAGVVVLFAVSSLIYFWFCIFSKRLRALSVSSMPVYVWLLSLLTAGIFKLLDYQNETLGLATEGWLTYTATASLIAALMAIAVFTYILWRGFSDRT